MSLLNKDIDNTILVCIAILLYDIKTKLNNDKILILNALYNNNIKVIQNILNNKTKIKNKYNTVLEYYYKNDITVFVKILNLFKNCPYYIKKYLNEIVFDVKYNFLIEQYLQNNIKTITAFKKKITYIVKDEIVYVDEIII